MKMIIINQKTKSVYFFLLYNLIANKRKRDIDNKINSKKPYGGFFDDL